jgi:hypothetical protein
MKKFKPLEIAPWAKAEQREKDRVARRTARHHQTRTVFVLLFLATVVVFVHNHQVEVQQLASRQIHRIMDKATLSDHLRDGALNYEKSIDSINEPAGKPVSQPENQPQNP